MCGGSRGGEPERVGDDVTTEREAGAEREKATHLPLKRARGDCGENRRSCCFCDFQGSGGRKNPILIEAFGWISNFFPWRIRL